MSIKINVLSDEEKKKRKEEERMGIALKLVISSIAVLVLINVVFFIMQIVLRIEYQAAKKASESSLVQNDGKEKQLESTFGDVNKQVAQLQKIKLSIPNWARVLVRLSELSPDGIRITSLAGQGSELKISGFSRTRDDFLQFQEKLRQEGFQFSVNIGNLVASENFNFDLDLNIPQDYLIRK